MLTEVERVDRHGFTQTELERAKKELLRQFERMYLERDKVRSSRESPQRGSARQAMTAEVVATTNVTGASPGRTWAN